jgi:hypothetical protein
MFVLSNYCNAYSDWVGRVPPALPCFSGNTYEYISKVTAILIGPKNVWFGLGSNVTESCDSQKQQIKSERLPYCHFVIRVKSRVNPIIKSGLCRHTVKTSQESDGLRY